MPYAKSHRKAKKQEQSDNRRAAGLCKTCKQASAGRGQGAKTAPIKGGNGIMTKILRCRRDCSYEIGTSMATILGKARQRPF